METAVVSRLLVATTNPGKVAELAPMLAGLGYEATGLDTLQAYDVAEETGDSFADNARDKARHYAAIAGCTTLADDSGLEVDALQGAPGVHSARYAGDGADDDANMTLLLQRMDGSADRRARFVCAVCVVAADGHILAQARGTVEGTLLTAPRGTGGFGYDPLFVPDEAQAPAGAPPVAGRTFAQMTREEKSARSHRGRAVAALIAQLGAAP